MARIAVIGPGAIGGMVAAWLGNGGRHAVTVCARTAFDSLEVATPYGALSVRPEVLTDPANASPVDWVLVATKSYHADAQHWLPRLRAADTPVAVLQNGVEHVERFASVVPRDRILPVVVMGPAERDGPGRIRQRGEISLNVPEGALGAELERHFAGTEIRFRRVDDFKTVAWHKLCLNASGVVSAIVRGTNAVARNPAGAGLIRAIVEEAAAVGRAEGARLDAGIADRVLEITRSEPEDGINSLNADHRAGRPTEIDLRNGVIVRLGRRHGIPTPLNEMAVALMSL